MKPIIQRIVMVIVPLWTSLTVFAYDFWQDGIYYNISSEADRSVQVTNKGDNGCYSGDIEIPKKLIYNGKTYTVTSIGKNAFYRCSGLTSVSIPNSVTSIGEWAFFGCRSLTSMTIGNSVTYIGHHAFNDCTNLDAINVDSDNTAFCSQDGILYNKEMTALIYCPAKKTAVSIPNSVTSIGEWAFFGCRSLTSVTIPNSVTSIGEFAFSGCSGLTSVTIPNSVTSIGSDAFSGCSGLEAINSQIVEPFECDPLFSDKILKNTILYIPKGTISAYEKVDPWRNFWNIEEMDYSGVKGIELDADSKIEVGRYNLQGRRFRLYRFDCYKIQRRYLLQTIRQVKHALYKAF